MVDLIIKWSFNDSICANRGFVGVDRSFYNFLIIWQESFRAMALAIGGLNSSAFSEPTPLLFNPFGKTDQNALNATVEAWLGPVSFVGKVGMPFYAGTPLLSHALGHNKPWLRKFIFKYLIV